MERLTVICTCDDNCDDPCPVHGRENALQDRVIGLENMHCREHEKRIGYQDLVYRTCISVDSCWLDGRAIMKDELPDAVKALGRVVVAARGVLADLNEQGFALPENQEMLSERLAEMDERPWRKR